MFDPTGQFEGYDVPDASELYHDMAVNEWNELDEQLEDEEVSKYE